MVPFLIGIGIAILAMAAGLGATALVPLADFPTIAFACSKNGIAGSECTHVAISAGTQSIAAYFILLIAGMLLLRRCSASEPIAQQHPVSTISLLLVSFVVLLSHKLALWVGPLHASRLDESEYFSNFISLENLLWPLLLQFYVTEQKRPMRIILLSALIMVMALTPYRATLLSILIFGIAAPLAVGIWRAPWDKWRRRLTVKIALQGLVAATIAATALWGAYVDTMTRAPSLLVHRDLQTTGASSPREAVASKISATPTKITVTHTAPIKTQEVPLPPENLTERMFQRVAFPLYQAAIAGHLVGTIQLPTIADELARKFRLSDAPTLEELLFRRIFGGETKNQTTSLYYGEAAAYFPGPAIIWMILGPLCLAVTGLVLLRYGIDATTIFGIGLWRSSFSGLLPVLPAIVLQVVGLASLSLLGAIASRAGRSIHRLSVMLMTVLTVVLFATLVVQCWSLVNKPTHNAVLVANFKVAEGCVLTSPTWVSIYADRAFMAEGLSISSATISATGGAATIGLPYAEKAATIIGKLPMLFRPLVHCSQPDVTAPIVLTSSQLLPWIPNPLEFLAALSMVIALWVSIRSVKANRSEASW